MLAPGLYDAPLPFASVFHDVNVYPTRTTLDDEGSVTFAPDAPSMAANEPLPPFATKLTVTGDVEVGGSNSKEGRDEEESGGRGGTRARRLGHPLRVQGFART